MTVCSLKYEDDGGLTGQSRRRVTVLREYRFVQVQIKGRDVLKIVFGQFQWILNDFFQYKAASRTAV